MPAAVMPGSWVSGPARAASVAVSAREVVFLNGRDRIHGTLEVPAYTTGQRIPGVVLIAGSGPTDRNGNAPASAINHIDILRHFADALAADGVASLRYDKYGTGRTGVATHPNPATVGFNLYVSAARAAFRYLAARPEIDSHRVAILGHSEGGLIALILGNRLTAAPAPRALILAAPPGLPILETIRDQVSHALDLGVQSGGITRANADEALAELDRIIAQLKQQGTVPTVIQTPGYASTFNSINAKFLSQEESYDPQALAARLRRAMPVLILHGTVDVQVTESDIHALQQAFETSGHTRAALYDLPQVDHEFKEVRGTPNPNPLIDYTNPALRFSRAAEARLKAFVRSSL